MSAAPRSVVADTLGDGEDAVAATERIVIREGTAIDIDLVGKSACAGNTR